MSATAVVRPIDYWRRRAWRLQAISAGFTPDEANALAFWRWLASQRGETGQRVVRLARV